MDLCVYIWNWASADIESCVRSISIVVVKYRAEVASFSIERSAHAHIALLNVGWL